MPPSLYQSCPPGLFGTRDLLLAHPDDKEAILNQALLERDRTKRLFETVHRTTSFQFISTIKSVLFVGLSVFSVIWAMGVVVQLAQWISNTSFSDFSPVASVFFGSGAKQASIVGTQPWLTRIANLPMLNWRDATLWAAIIMILIVLERAYTSYITWRDTRFLKQGKEDITREIETLESWKQVSAHTTSSVDA